MVCRHLIRADHFHSLSHGQLAHGTLAELLATLPAQRKVAAGDQHLEEVGGVGCVSGMVAAVSDH